MDKTPPLKEVPRRSSEQDVWETTLISRDSKREGQIKETALLINDLVHEETRADKDDPSTFWEIYRIQKPGTLKGQAAVLWTIDRSKTLPRRILITANLFQERRLQFTTHSEQRLKPITATTGEDLENRVQDGLLTFQELSAAGRTRGQKQSLLDVQ